MMELGSDSTSNSIISQWFVEFKPNYIQNFILSLVFWIILDVNAKWQVVCAKVREGDKRIVRIKEGNPAGCHVVIVDDLVQSGGTLIECQVIVI